MALRADPGGERGGAQDPASVRMRPWRRVGVALGACACLALGALGAAFLAGASLDLSRWRDAAALRASAALGRPVALQGALQLSLGRPLRLRIGGLRISNPPGFGAADFATVGAATLRIDPLDVLRGRLRLRGVEASDVVLRLERAGDGRGNWSFPPARASASPPAAIDPGPIRLQRLLLQFHDQGSATRRSIEVDELSARIGPDDPLRLALQGPDASRHRYQLRVEGASLQALQQAREPWPFSLEFKSADAWLQAQGTLDARQGEARFYLGAGAGDLARAAGLPGAGWLPPGGASLNANVSASSSGIALTQLQGRLGDAALSGHLGWSRDAARPRLSGALQLASLDLRPWLQADPPSPARVQDDAPAWHALALRDAVPADVDLELGVGRWLGLPLPIQDVKLRLLADARGVHAPLSATLAGAAVSGQLDLDLAAPTPGVALRLDARDIALDGLARELAALQGLQGRLGRAALRLKGSGETPAALLQGLEATVEMAAAQLNYRHAGLARPLAFTLDTLQLGAARGEPLRGSAQGALLGQRTRLSVRAGTVAEMLRGGSVPLHLALAQDRATLRVQGALGPAAAARDTALDFELQARNSGDLARWLPVAPESALPVALRGRLRRSTDAWSLQRGTLDIGRSRLQIDAQRSRSDGRPLTTARVRGALLDVQQLSTLSAGARAPAAAGARLDAPILAGAIELSDADLDLALQQVWLGRTELRDVVAVARTRDGRLLPSPLTGRLGGAPFTAQVEFDARGELPAAQFDLRARDIDVGALLSTLGVAEDIEARADSLQLALQARGNSWRELAAGTSLQARLSGGALRVLGAARRPAADILVQEAAVEAAAGQPLQLRLSGRLEQTPVRLEVSTGSFADFAGDASRVPFAMAAQAAGTRLSLDGEVSLPLGRAGQLSFEVGGPRLDSLNELARVELPAWGPWSLRGPIRMTDTGYALQGLTLAVGQSRLHGSGELELGGTRPRAELRLQAPRIRLDDFPMPERLSDPLEPPPPDGGVRGTAARTAGRIDRLLSARFLRRFDAQVDARADEVLSGADRLADGAFHLKLREGRLDLDPAVLNLPGGGMRLSMSYDLKQSEVDFHVAAQVERFDYGIVARRLQRANDLRGLFSMNLYLAGRAPSLHSMLRHADGRLDVAVWPTELRSGVFNLWSANLVLALLPLIDPGQKSQVNCIVARFDLQDGGLSEDQFLIDTSTVRVRGTGHADLSTEELAFVFRPRAKGPGLFRLQTPLRVSGTFTDQRFGFDAEDVFYSGLRMVFSPILVPIERLMLGPLPRDGADVCTAPLRAIAR